MNDFCENIILASGSPRRRELMALLGLPYRVVVADIDERSAPAESPDHLVRRLSRDKGWQVACSVEQGVIIAADTIVVVDDTVLGKPATADDARAMLATLRGRPHRVLSSVTVIRRPPNQEWTECAETAVTMRDYSDQEIEAYIASGDPMDKAGAYAIQHSDFHPTANIAGCYASVMGFPLCHVYRALQQIGLARAQRPAAACQRATRRACTYHPHVLPSVDAPPTTE